MRPRAQKMAHEHIDLLTRQQDGEHMGWEGEAQPGRYENKKLFMSILTCSQDDKTETTWVGRGSPGPGDNEHIILLTRRRDGEHIGWEGRSQIRRP